MIRLLAILLLGGSVLLILCSAVHPILPLTAAGDLALIRATPYWHSIHVGLLYATGLIIAGIWARWLAAEQAERAGLGAAFVVFSIGQALNAVNIAFMTGAGTLFAAQAAQGMAVGAIYESSHQFAVTCGRLAGFLVATAAILIAMTTTRRATEPRWLVGVAAVAGGAGILGNALATPGHPLMLTSVGLMALWQAGTAGRILWKGAGEQGFGFSGRGSG
jgi:hypothetical protein